MKFINPIKGKFHASLVLGNWSKWKHE